MNCVFNAIMELCCYYCGFMGLPFFFNYSTLRPLKVVEIELMILEIEMIILLMFAVVLQLLVIN